MTVYFILELRLLIHSLRVILSTDSSKMELAKLDVSDTTDMNANILQSLIWLYGDREEYQSVEAFNAHLDAVSAVKQQQDEEMKTAFFSGPAPDWVGHYFIVIE